MFNLNKPIIKQITFLTTVLFVFSQFGFVASDLCASDFPGKTPPQTTTGGSFKGRIFRAGDAVQISVFPDTTSFLHKVFPIDGNGNVFLPLVGKVSIENMSSDEFVDYLKNNFTQYLRNPNIQIRPLMRVSVLGGFVRPGMYYIDPTLSLWDLIHRAGGTLHEKGLEKMKWERNNNEIKDNMIPMLESGRSLQELGFQSGDQLHTPSPGQPSLVSRITQFFPFITVSITAYTLYITMQTRGVVR